MLIQRIMRVIMPWTAANLPVHKEIRQDEKATNEAGMILIAVAVATLIGYFLGGLIGGGIVWAIVWAIIGALFYLLGFAAFAVVAYFMVTKAYKTQITYKEVFRVLGYPQVPMVVNLLHFIPILGPFLWWLGWAYAMVLSFFAVRESTGLDTTKSIITVAVSAAAMIFVGYVIPAILSVILFVIF